ncbi:MAG TPA: hypothetical protein VFZ96_09430, partial [Actinomycetota bacterium]|nr:hypothetical protein [Actinomycetota bacterium]
MGEPAPLPRDLRGAAQFWIAVVVLLALGYAIGSLTGVLGRVQRAIDDWAVDLLSTTSEGAAGEAGRWVDRMLPWELLIVLRWSVAIAIAAFRRWRHLAVFVGSVALVTLVARWFPTAGAEGSGVSGEPSEAMAGTAVTMLGIVYGLAPPGRLRTGAMALTGALLAILGAALLLTGENTLSEIAIGLGIGISIPFLGYRIFTPQ